MLRPKKLDLYVIHSFVPVFVGSFLICLFVFIMQFTWRYLEELIGKGLSVEILAEFFGYTAITLVPMALPLSVLLAMLISFGNLGERFELLAMRSAGISLLRIMRPLFFIALFMAAISFYFQNNVATIAQIKIRQLLISMKMTSPVIDIPEGVFYNGIPDINLYVAHKDAATGMLYQLIIYKIDRGVENAQIVLADSGKLEMTADKHYLKLQLWSGEQFENLQNTSLLTQHINVPFDRESFTYKQLFIAFDANFNLLDKNMLQNTPSAKNMYQLEQGVDSIDREMDSIGFNNYSSASALYNISSLQRHKLSDSTQSKQKATSQRVVSSLSKTDKSIPPFDTLFTNLPREERLNVVQAAYQRTSGIQNDWDWRKVITEENKMLQRRFWIEWHTKIALSLSCIIFFFVGGSLGAIIRKGGLGLPTVVSVVIFIFYYIFNTSGMKLAREGSWSIVTGMWMSTAIFAPLGAWLTYQANRDSMVFNLDAYILFIRRLFGLRTPRHLVRKEVIIEDPDYTSLLSRLNIISNQCQNYLTEHSLSQPASYFRTYFFHKEEQQIATISSELESVILQLSYTKYPQLITLLNRFPTLYIHAHLSPFRLRWQNVAVGVFLPFGILIWLRIWRFRLRLQRDLRLISKTNTQVLQYLQTKM